jgi:hypothetical protein
LSCSSLRAREESTWIPPSECRLAIQFTSIFRRVTAGLR